MKTAAARLRATRTTTASAPTQFRDLTATMTSAVLGLGTVCGTPEPVPVPVHGPPVPAGAAPFADVAAACGPDLEFRIASRSSSVGFTWAVGS
jgi:hypothetical protein